MQRQYFHADESDIVGLLCIASALEGGESDIASVHQVYNILRRERPDVLETLTEPIWYFDRKGEVSKGQDPYIRASVLYLEPGGQGRIYCKYVFCSFKWYCCIANDIRDGIRITFAPSIAFPQQASFQRFRPHRSKLLTFLNKHVNGRLCT